MDRKRWRIVLIAAVIAASPFVAALGRAEEKASEEKGKEREKVEQRDDIEQRLSILERQREIDQEKAAATAGAGKEGFFLKAPDGSWIVRFRGIVQLDGRFWSDDREKPQVDTFLLRRVRPILEGTVARFVDFRFVPDFGEGKTVIQDAYVEARFSPRAKLRAGKFKSPFGLERLQSASEILFVERALPTNLVPNRDMGLQVSGDVAEGVLTYAAAYLNGVADLGSADADTNDSKEVAARVFYLPFKKSPALALQGLGIGLAATHGQNRGSASATGLPAYKTPGQATFFSYRAPQGEPAGTAFADGERWRITPQGYFFVNRFGIIAEFVQASQEVRLGASAAEIENRAWQATASFLLTNDVASYRGVSPKRPFDPKAGADGRHGWGAIELAARYGRLEVDDKAFPVFADPAASARAATEMGLGVNWYVNRNLRLMLDGLQTQFEGGRTPNGDRETERVLLARFQVAF